MSKPKKINILVIGATGFLGRHLIPKLTNYQHELHCLVRNPENVDKKLFPKNIHLIKGDITNRSDLIAASKNIDIIINLSTPNTQIATINNQIIVEGAINIIEAAKINKVGQIIHLSSVAGYRKNLDNYGKSKREADKLFMTSDLNVILLKPTMIYGRGGYIFEKLVGSVTKIPFFVFVVGNGKYKIQPVYVEDVVAAILTSVKLEKHSNIFDLGGLYPIAYNDFIEKILKIMGKKKIIIHIPVGFVILLVKFLGLFIKDLAFNATSVKRMVEEVTLNIEPAKEILKVKFTDYDQALKRLFS